MSVSRILSLHPGRTHNSLQEGLRLGAITASVTWVWVVLVDVVAGTPFHTFNALGGIVAFTALHYVLHTVYAIAVLAAIHGAERAPSLIIAAIFGVVSLESAIGMMTNLLAHAALGRVAWIGIFGGSLIATGVAFILLSKTHPLALYLRRAEAET
jgi:hypothetical protein